MPSKAKRKRRKQQRRARREQRNSGGSDAIHQPSSLAIANGGQEPIAVVNEPPEDEPQVLVSPESSRAATTYEKAITMYWENRCPKCDGRLNPDETGKIDRACTGCGYSWKHEEIFGLKDTLPLFEAI